MNPEGAIVECLRCAKAVKALSDLRLAMLAGVSLTLHSEGRTKFIVPFSLEVRCEWCNGTSADADETAHRR